MPRFESSRLIKSHHAIKTPLFLSSMDIELRGPRSPPQRHRVSIAGSRSLNSVPDSFSSSLRLHNIHRILVRVYATICDVSRVYRIYAIYVRTHLYNEKSNWLYGWLAKGHVEVQCPSSTMFPPATVSLPPVNISFARICRVSIRCNTTCIPFCSVKIRAIDDAWPNIALEYYVVLRWMRWINAISWHILKLKIRQAWPFYFILETNYIRIVLRPESKFISYFWS